MTAVQMQNALKQLNERIPKAFGAFMTVTENGCVHSPRLEMIYLVITIDSIVSYTNRNVYSAADIQAHSVYSAENHNLSMQMTRWHICARHIMEQSYHRFSQVLRLIYIIHCTVLPWRFLVKVTLHFASYWGHLQISLCWITLTCYLKTKHILMLSFKGIEGNIVHPSWQHSQRNISEVMCIRGCVGLLFFKDCSQMFKQSCLPEHNPKPVPVTINTSLNVPHTYCEENMSCGEESEREVRNMIVLISGVNFGRFNKGFDFGSWMSCVKTSAAGFPRLANTSLVHLSEATEICEFVIEDIDLGFLIWFQKREEAKKAKASYLGPVFSLDICQALSVKHSGMT